MCGADWISRARSPGCRSRRTRASRSSWRPHRHAADRAPEARVLRCRSALGSRVHRPGVDPHRRAATIDEEVRAALPAPAHAGPPTPVRLTATFGVHSEHAIGISGRERESALPERSATAGHGCTRSGAPSDRRRCWRAAPVPRRRCGRCQECRPTRRRRPRNTSRDRRHSDHPSVRSRAWRE